MCCAVLRLLALLYFLSEYQPPLHPPGPRISPAHYPVQSAPPPEQPPIPPCSALAPVNLSARSRWGPRDQHHDFLYACRSPPSLDLETETWPVKQFIRNVRAAKTIADERAVVQKESAAIRASFREESHDSGVRCVPNTHSSRGILAHRTPGETMSPSSCIYSPWARGHILARSNV